jgi:hypothetical protein
MPKRLLYFFSLIICLAATSAFSLFAEQPANETNTSFDGKVINRKLTNVDWTDQKQVEAMLHDWLPYNDDQSGGKGFKDKKILKQQEFDFKPYPMSGRLHKYNDSGRHEIVYYNSESKSTDNDFSACANLLNSLSEQLGKPIKTLNRAKGASSDETATKLINAQWKLGKTKVNVDCSIVRIFDKVLMLGNWVTISDERYIPELQDLIHLSCTHNLKYVGVNKPTTIEPPMHIIIDPNMKSLESNSHTLGKVKVYNENEITVIGEEKKFTSVFSLNRLTSNYTLFRRLRDDPHMGIDAWGECKKVSVAERI